VPFLKGLTAFRDPRSGSSFVSYRTAPAGERGEHPEVLSGRHDSTRTGFPAGGRAEKAPVAVSVAMAWAGITVRQRKERLAMESLSQVHQQGGQDGAPEHQDAPSSSQESLVQEISALWEEHFTDREVGAEDDFFALGGNSLIGIKLIERVSQDYGVQLSVRDFYLAQTPARVAELIEQGRAAA
jgi:acyl carrier protein